MYDIRDELGNVIDSRPTFDEAEQRIEEICAQATEQAAASGEGTRGMNLRWTIYDTRAGEVVGFMVLSPDDSGQPYTPISQAAAEREEHQA
ncbi:hypothetical protein [Nonomuraea sp. 10N515B]|uniref:hypothetical protein n=1 Tax=Nonomuraea sp. 10N515B TaxID=3457422 RepID=UPI003FCCE626